MESLSLDRFELGSFLGSGSDYEAHAATDLETGKMAVVKRPNVDYILRGLHKDIDLLSRSLIEIHDSVANSVRNVSKMMGYTDVRCHGSYFGDTPRAEYRVLVFERAKGIPLVADIRDRFKGVPIGLGQNLFVLHPADFRTVDENCPVPQQLLDVESSFQAGGHLLLDLRPQNIYFDPADGNITVIDVGTVPTLGATSQGQISSRGQHQDIHDFFAEVFRHYLCPDLPPADAKGYGDAYGMRADPDFAQQVDGMIGDFAKANYQDLAEAAVGSLQKVRWRSYGSIEKFRCDLQLCLDAARRRDNLQDENNPALGVWRQARKQLDAPYWDRFLFDRDSGI